MMRIAIALLSLALCARPLAQPAPRVTLDVELPSSNGFRIDTRSMRGKIAVGRDGAYYLLLDEVTPARDPASSAPPRAARVQILAVGADGTVRLRRTLPLRRAGGFWFEGAAVAIARSGDVAILVFRNSPSPDGIGHRQAMALLRLAPDFSLRKTSPIRPPSPAHGRDDPRARYVINAILPTPDNALLLTGAWGSGPYAWWMGKFSLDGVRVWQAGAGNGFPEYVRSTVQRSDGSWVNLITEVPEREEQPFIRRYTPGGRLLARTRLPYPFHYAGAVLRDGCLLVSDEDKAPRELLFLDDGGRLRYRTPWPFGETRSIMAHGDGFAALVAGERDGVFRIVRADARGAVLWLGDAAEIEAIVPTPDGQVAALVTRDDKLRLVRYADP